jgi:hypothetical protein
MSGWGHCCGAAASHLTSMMQVTCFAPRHAADGKLGHSNPCEQFDHLVCTYDE